MVTTVVKRSGASEPYVEQKLHDSIAAALLSVRSLEGEAALLASRVSREVFKWCEEKVEVTSRDIRVHARESLAILHAEAAYAYDIHDNII